MGLLSLQAASLCSVHHAHSLWTCKFQICNFNWIALQLYTCCSDPRLRLLTSDPHPWTESRGLRCWSVLNILFPSTCKVYIFYPLFRSNNSWQGSNFPVENCFWGRQTTADALSFDKLICLWCFKAETGGGMERSNPIGACCQLFSRLDISSRSHSHLETLWPSEASLRYCGMYGRQYW